MPGLFTTMLLAAAVAWPAGGSAPNDVDFKCSARIGGDPDMPETVVVLDLEVVEDWEQHKDQLDAPWNQKQIAVAAIACWGWLEAQFGVEVRRGGAFLLTREWMEQTRRDRVAALEALVSAQDRHREMTGEYAARVEDLPDFGVLSDYGLPDHLQLELSGTGAGWRARLEPDEDWFRPQPHPIGATYHCFAFAGDVPERWETMRLGGGPGPGEREPACFEPKTLVRPMRRG